MPLVEKKNWKSHASTLRSNGTPENLVTGPSTLDVAMTGGGNGKLQIEVYINEEFSKLMGIVDGGYFGWELFLEPHQQFAIVYASTEKIPDWNATFAINRQEGGTARHSVKLSNITLEQAELLFSENKRWAVSKDDMVKGRTPGICAMEPCVINGVLVHRTVVDLHLQPARVANRSSKPEICECCGAMIK